MQKSYLRIAAAAVIPLVIGIAACGSSPNTAQAGSASDSSSSSACQPQKGKVNITFWSWEGGIGPVVAEFNATHPDIHVTVDTIATGDYQSMYNALKAGNAPDLAMVEYDELPSFRLQNGLTNIANCAPMKNMSSQFPSWTVNQVSVGSSAIYGVPEDIEPLALYYRKDIFTKYHLPVPTTWAQYEADALKLKAANPSIKMTAMTSADEGLLIGLDWQNGAQLFQYNGNTFTFDMDSPQANQVANYWETLVRDGVINTTAKFLTPAEYVAWNDGTVATSIGPDYESGFIGDNAPTAKGDWAVAPLPQWKPGDNSSGDDGGSATAVLAGTKHPYADAVFADWLGTNSDVFQLYAGQVLAGANSYLNSSYINTPNPYFGGQRILQVFKKASAQVNTSFQWAPNQTDVTNDLTDALESAFNGSSTISAAFKTAQTEAAASLSSQGVTVKVK
jgi:multiple sugar transport system substrate-binding protein